MTAASCLTGDLDADAGVLVIVAAVGAIGGLAQYAVVKDPTDTIASPWKSVVVGVVAAIGALWANSGSDPQPELALIGQSLLAGYFGRAVLVALQTRVTAALERDRKERALAVAHASIDLVERERQALTAPIGTAPVPPATPTPASPDLVALRARLIEIEGR